MIKNYVKIAWRNLKNKPLYTTINILGLSTGISFAVLISAFVWQELKVNKNLKNAESQYILTSKWKDPNMGVDFATIGGIPEKLKEEYPHLVANYYRWDGITSIVSNGTENFREGIQLGDESLLKMYDFNLMHGNAESAFEKPFSVVVNSEKAIKLFGRTNVVGKTLRIQNFDGGNREFTITGVLNKVTDNSVIPEINNEINGIFIAKNSAKYFDRAHFEDWEVPFFVCYLQLQPGVGVNELELPIKNILGTHASLDIQKNLEVVPKKLTDYYLNRNNSKQKQMLYTLSFVGLFIVIMAIINFINITIGFSGSRTKEIGVRKVLGGQRKQLIFQFVSESIVLVTIATAIALFSYPFLSNWFEALIGKEIIALTEFPLYLLCVPFLLILVIGLLAGFYPAFVLSSHKSIDALNGKFKIGKNDVYFRKMLLGFQFVMALVVLIVALLVTKQLDSFFGKGLGYDKEYVITAQAPRDWSLKGVQKMLTVRNEFQKMPSVENVSLSYEIPNGNNGFQLSVYREGQNPEESFSTQSLVSDEAFIETYEIPLLAGEFFEANEQNANKVIINEEALHVYGFNNALEAIGQNLHVVGEKDPLIIKGVISNFHFESLHETIKPQLFFNVLSTNYYRYLSFKLKPGNIENGLTEIQQKWQDLLPNSSFEYRFFDETLADLYQTEIQFEKATYTASLLSLIIALLGIFGMVSLSINKRIKEIGIRKVLGASAKSISYLFVKDFLQIICVSILVACPIAYLLVNKWLANYAYKIDVGVGSFLVGILLVGSITILLILFQTLKTAIANPVDSLKTE